MSALFPVLTYKPTYAVVDIPCIADECREIFRRVGKTNSLRLVATFTHQGQEYVAKTYSRNLGEITWRDMLKAKDSFDQAARYLPVAPTLFVYGHESEGVNAGEPTIIRIQECYHRRLCDLSDDELRAPAIKSQLLAFLDRCEGMIDAAGWLPDLFGHPANPADIPYWPSIRRSTNIMVSDAGRVAFVDINHPQPWNATANPVGRAALSAVRLRLDEFRRFLQDDQ